MLHPGARDTFRSFSRLPGDRLQEVVIEATEGKNNERYLSVFSVCGPADPAYFAYALKLNAHLTFGSISIHDVLGSPMFVMSRTFSRDTVHPEDVRDALLEIARRADPSKSNSRAWTSTDLRDSVPSREALSGVTIRHAPHLGVAPMPMAQDLTPTAC